MQPLSKYIKYPFVIDVGSELNGAYRYVTDADDNQLRFQFELSKDSDPSIVIGDINKKATIAQLQEICDPSELETATFQLTQLFTEYNKIANPTESIASPVLRYIQNATEESYNQNITMCTLDYCWQVLLFESNSTDPEVE